MELSPSHRNGVLLDGLVKYPKFKLSQATNCKVAFVYHQCGLKISRTHMERKMTVQHVSVWMFKEEEKRALDASLLGVSDDSWPVPTDKRKNISVCISRTAST